jgi:hypothetical protein
MSHLSAQLFDSRFYDSQRSLLSKLFYPDSLKHFENIGFKQELNPNIHFDIKTYISENEDVRDSNLNPFTHFIEYGAVEGRIYSKDVTKLLGIRSDILLEDLADFKNNSPNLENFVHAIINCKIKPKQLSASYYETLEIVNQFHRIFHLIYSSDNLIQFICSCSLADDGTIAINIEGKEIIFLSNLCKKDVKKDTHSSNFIASVECLNYDQRAVMWLIYNLVEYYPKNIVMFSHCSTLELLYSSQEENWIGRVEFV